MKKGLRNLLVRFAATLTSGPKGGRVISLHEINDSALFQDFLDWLQQERIVLSLDDLLAEREPAGKIALTFDDGFASWTDLAAPILQERKIPAAFFVCSGCIGLKGSQAASFISHKLFRTQKLQFISAGQLRDLANDPLFCIGSHTVHHADLGDVRGQRELVEEIEGDRKTLQDLTAQAVKYFAYPFGKKSNISDQAREMVKNAGFKAAFTYIPGNYTPATDRFLIPRDGLDLKDGRKLWGAWLKGGYDWLYQLKSEFI